jgi:integrase
LRAGEVVRLKVKHIDKAQKIIRIEQSKGRKDRHVMLSPETLDLLRQWWKARPPAYDARTPVKERWLFPGRKPGKPMTTRQLIRAHGGVVEERTYGGVGHLTLIGAFAPGLRLLAPVLRDVTQFVWRVTRRQTDLCEVT